MIEHKVQLDTFCGPLDLLLYLVKRDEIEIFDIPIARVADQFLVALGDLETVDVEWAGDFLVMAATLMEIKSKMLLPRPEEATGEDDDPRLELVKQLIEYKKYKEAATLLDKQARLQLLRLPRVPASRPGPPDPSQQPLQKVELWDLVSAFARIVRETMALQPRQIVMDDTPIQVHMDRIEEIVKQEGRVSFERVFTPPLTRGRLLGLFLAILELIKGQRIAAEQESVFGDIWLAAAPLRQRPWHECAVRKAVRRYKEQRFGDEYHLGAHTPEAVSPIMENPARDVPAPAPAPQPAGQLRPGGAADRIVIIQHSDLFYWWPVWAFGFLFALITFVTDDHMAIVPRGTKALAQRKVEVEPGLEVVRDVLVLDQGRSLLTRRDEKGATAIAQPTLFVSRYKSVGVMYMFILLIVTFITNVPLRGLWSFVVMLSVLMLSIIFALAGWWDIIFEYLDNLSIYINMGGYLLVSTVLFVQWMIAFLFLDRQMYVIFTPGQVRLCTEIGGSETIYDTFGMTVQKQRSDLFRHWVLGFGSGDLLLRFAKVEHPIEMHNVLNITSSLKKVERLVQEKVVISEPAQAVATPVNVAKP